MKEEQPDTGMQEIEYLYGIAVYTNTTFTNNRFRVELMHTCNYDPAKDDQFAGKLSSLTVRRLDGEFVGDDKIVSEIVKQTLGSVVYLYPVPIQNNNTNHRFYMCGGKKTPVHHHSPVPLCNPLKITSKTSN